MTVLRDLTEMLARSANSHDLRQWSRLRFVVALIVLLSLLSGTSIAAEPKSAEAPKPAAPAPPPADIPLGDIATRATEVSNLLGTLTAGAAPSAQIENIAKALPEWSEKLDAQFAATTKSLEAEPTLDTLQSLQQDRQRRQLEATGRVWPSHFNQAGQVKSDLAAALYDAVNAAGMSFPFPQREVRLLRNPVADSNGDIAKPAAKSSARSNEDESPWLLLPPPFLRNGI